MVDRNSPDPMSHHAPPPRRRGTMRWWRQTLLELAVLYTLVVTAEILIGDGRIGSFRLHPHPYWLVVLPMAAGRGLVAGLVAAAVGSVLYAIGAQDSLSADGFLEIFDLDVMLEPLLFHAVGFVVGEFRDVITDRYRAQAQRLADVQQKALRFRKQRDVLADANRILEKRLVDHSAQFGNLIVTATRIELAGRREVFEIALELVEEHCGAAASILIQVGDSIDFVCHRGWPRNEETERLEDARGSAFVDRALSTGIEVNGFAAGESAPPRGPLIVAPLISEAGVVEALLCLDEIPTSRLNPSTVRTFLAIGEWVGAALSRLDRESGPRTGTKSAGGSVMPASSRLGTSDALGLRLRMEYERCTRYGVPLAVIAVQFPTWSETSPVRLAMLDRFVRRHFTYGLRDSDGVYRFGFPGCYLVVMGGTPVQNAGVVCDRLYARMLESLDESIGRVVMAATGPDPDAPDPANLLERLVSEFVENSALRLGQDSPVALPSRAPVQGLGEFMEMLTTEVTMAARGNWPLQVLDIRPQGDPDVHPARLAMHVEQLAAECLRDTDAAFRIGGSHVAVVLPHTHAEEAETIAARLLVALAARDPSQPFGELQIETLSFGVDYPDGASFVEAMGEERPLYSVEPIGGGE